MLLAPLLVETESHQQRSRVPCAPMRRVPSYFSVGQAPAAHASGLPVLLVAWAALGLTAWICIPAARRGGDTWGATAPFWLIVAPLLDLIWLKRGSLRSAVRDGICELHNRRSQPRCPSRLRSIRRRNSSMIRRYKSSPR